MTEFDIKDLINRLNINLIVFNLYKHFAFIKQYITYIKKNTCETSLNRVVSHKILVSKPMKEIRLDMSYSVPICVFVVRMRQRVRSGSFGDFF